jgi:sugar phosphate isomerase/epimerase
MMRPISISTVAYDGHPLEAAIEGVAALGLGLVEPAYIRGYMVFGEEDFEAPASAALRRRMRDAGLSAIAVSAHMDQGHEDAPAMLARRIRHTAAIGARICITNSTTIDRRDALLRTLEATHPIAEALDVVIALENPGNGPTNLMRDGAAGARLLAELGMERVRLNYDTANALTCTEGAVRPETDIAAALPLCVNLHLKDARRLQDRWAYAPLGEGEIDYDALLAACAGRPDLPMTVELPLRLVRRFHEEPTRDPAVPTVAAVGEAIARSLRRIGARGP